MAEAACRSRRTSPSPQVHTPTELIAAVDTELRSNFARYKLPRSYHVSGD